MDNPPQDSRDLSGWVGRADLTAQFPLTWSVGGEGAQIRLQSSYVTSAMNGACSWLIQWALFSSPR